jgi:putative transposase
MSSFTSLTYHVIFATKNRTPSISNDFKQRLHEYMGGLIRERKGCSIEIGGVADHVHILARFPPSIAVSDMIRDVKAVSSKWINDNQLVVGRFEWQVGFAAFTVTIRASSRCKSTSRIKKCIIACEGSKTSTLIFWKSTGSRSTGGTCLRRSSPDRPWSMSAAPSGLQPLVGITFRGLPPAAMGARRIRGFGSTLQPRPPAC